MKPFRPLLAESVDDLKALRWPLLISPKIDGIRAIGGTDGRLMSRSGKPFPNAALNALFNDAIYLPGIDGELVVGDPTAEDAFRRTESVVMAKDASIDGLVFHAFDLAPVFRYGETRKFNLLDDEGDYSERLECLHDCESALTEMGIPVKLVQQDLASSAEEALIIERAYLAAGYEGIMLRDPHGIYKEGRSSLREQILLKLKRFHEAEAEIIGFQERQRNDNAPTVDALGHTKRSSHKANMVGMNTLGALHVRDLKTGVEFDIGTGFDDKTRQRIWDNSDHFTGKVVKYRFFPTGSKDKPRFPTFLWFRDAIDMGE